MTTGRLLTSLNESESVIGSPSPVPLRTIAYQPNLTFPCQLPPSRVRAAGDGPTPTGIAHGERCALSGPPVALKGTSTSISCSS
eukprot:3062990-Prymnesium_polylepis.1